MQCRNCHTEIADKAIICYKCGTATIEAKHQPPAPRRASRASLVATVLALALVVLLAVHLGRQPAGETPSAVTYAAVAAVAVLIVGLRAYARRRR
jgi:hypothetical protein